MKSVIDLIKILSMRSEDLTISDGINTYHLKGLKEIKKDDSLELMFESGIRKPTDRSLLFIDKKNVARLKKK